MSTDRYRIKKLHYRVVMALFVMLLPFSAAALTPAGYGAILEDIDNLQNFGDRDFTTIYSIVSEKPGEEREVLETRLFRRDRDDLFLLIIISPEIQKGQGYLQVENNLWFYDPESRIRALFRFGKISRTLMPKTMISWCRHLLKIISLPVMMRALSAAFLYMFLDLEATNDEVAYPKMKLWVRQSPTLPMKAEEYGFSGRLMRNSAYLNYVKVGEKYLPTRILRRYA